MGENGDGTMEKCGIKERRESRNIFWGGEQR